MARQIVVELTGNSSGFTHATAKAEESAGHFGNVIQGIAQGIGQGIWGAAIQGIHMAIDAVKQSDQAFRDDQVSVTQLMNTIKNTQPTWNGNAASIEKMVSSYNKIGFEAIETRNAFGQLMGVTHNTKDAQNDLALAANFARAHQLDLGTAVDIVSKASEGNVKALKKYGIVVPGVTTAVDALTHSHKKYTPAQLAAAQAADKAATVTKTLAAMTDQARGAAGAYADTSAGKLAAAQAENTASWVKIGAIVDRVSSVVLPMAADALSHVADAAGPLADWIQNHLWPALQQVGSIIAKTLVPVIETQFVPQIKEIWRQMQPLMPTLKTVGMIIGVVIVAAIIAVVVAIGVFIKGILNLVQAFTTAADWIVATVPKIGAAFSAFGSHVSGIWGGITSGARAAFNAIASAWNRTVGSINFTVPGWVPGMGGDHWSMPRIPTYHQGGTVPGSGNVLAMLEGGETVIPRGGARHITINIYGTMNDGPAMDRFTNEITRRLKFASGV